MIAGLDRRAIGVFAAGWATFVNLYTPQAILPMLAHDLGATPASIGLSITVSLLAVALIAPVAGAISDRLGRKRLILAALVLVLVPTLGIAQSATLNQLLVWRFAQGLLMPFIFAVTIAYVGDETSGGEAIRLAGVYATGTIFGGFSGRFIAGLVSDAAGWRMVFVVLAGLTALAALLVAWLLPMERKFRPVSGGLAATLQAYRQHLRNRRLLGTCAVGFGMLFCNVATFTYINFSLAAPPLSLSPTQLGFLFTVYLLGMVTTPIATAIAIRLGRRWTLTLLLLLAILGAGLTILPHLWAVILGLCLIVAGLFAAQALATGFIGVAARQSRSSAVGLYVTVFYIGGSAGGILPGWVWHRSGWPGVVALIAAVMAAMIAFAQASWRDPQGG